MKSSVSIHKSIGTCFWGSFLLTSIGGYGQNSVASNHWSGFLDKGILNESVSSNNALSSEALSLLNEYGYSPAIVRSVGTMLAIADRDWLAGPYPADQREAIISAHDFPNPEDYAQYVFNCVLLKQKNPDWSDFRIAAVAYWQILTGVVHTALDICGLVPVGGEPCDLASGLLYVVEGDGVNASLSFAATIPLVGWAATGAKYAKILVETPSGIKTLTTTLKNGDVVFGRREELRAILNITDPLAQAHHIIPWGKQDNFLVQLAAKADDVPFHMNHVKNGLEAKAFRYDMPDGIHANHPQYDMRVENRMNAIRNALAAQYQGINNIPPNVASEKLRALQDEIRNVMQTYPTVKINELVF